MDAQSGHDNTPEAVDDLLSALLRAAGVGPHGLDTDAIDRTDLGADDLLALWRLIGGDETGPGLDDFTDAVMAVCAAQWPEGSAPPDELGLRLGRWRIDLAKAGIRTGLLSTVIAATLVEQGQHGFSVAFVTAVLPTVFEIERIELTAREKRLLADLRLKPAMQSGWATEDELYTALPQSAREVINRYDFADFVKRMRDLSEIDHNGSGLIRIRPDPRQS